VQGVRQSVCLRSLPDQARAHPLGHQTVPLRLLQQGLPSAASHAPARGDQTAPERRNAGREHEGGNGGRAGGRERDPNSSSLTQSNSVEYTVLFPDIIPYNQ